MLNVQTYRTLELWHLGTTKCFQIVNIRTVSGLIIRKDNYYIALYYIIFLKPHHPVRLMQNHILVSHTM